MSTSTPSTSRLWHSPSKRMRRAYFVAFQVMAAYMGLWLASHWRSRAKHEQRMLALHERNALKIRQTILELQGLFIKVGQLLSIMTSFLPDAYAAQLESLQDQIPPRPWDEVQARITSELGQPVDSLFSHIDQTALAAASIGQAHRAVLPDGSQVVVKVQHANIEQVAHVDLLIIKRLQQLISWWFDIKGMNFLYEQVRQMIEEELDFTREATAMQTIAINLADQPGLLIPQVFPTLSSQRVLTTCWCEGVKISQLDQIDAWGIDRDHLLNGLWEMYCRMIFRDGYYHADPHPGNILVQPDGTLVLLDFGAVATLSPNMREGMADLIEAAVKNDTGSMIEAARKMGFIAAGRDAEDLAEQMIIALRSFIQHEVKIDSLNFKDIQIDPFNNSLFHLVQQIGLSGITRTVQVPREFVLLNRMLTLLLGITGSLSPRYNPLSVIRPYMQEFVLGSRGSLQGFISQLLRSTLTNTLALPEEITQTLRLLKRDKISIRTPDQLTAARLIYEGLHQLALVALATLTWLYAPATTWYLREALLLLWAWLAWRSVLRARQLYG